MLMVMCTKVNGEMIKHMVSGNTCTQMELNMKVFGRRTSNTAREKKPGLMEHATKETMLMARRMEQESSDGLMDQHTRDNS